MFRKLLLAVLVVVVFSPAFGQVQVFVTSQATTGNIGGQAGGDSFCTLAAQNEGLPGTWIAWLGPGSCATCADMADRIIDGEYQLLDGTVVANNKADLLDGDLDASIQMMETGLIMSSNFGVWTGADEDGNHTSFPGTCTAWTTNVSTMQGRIGFSNATDATWTNSGGGANCDASNRLYCFSTVNVPVEMEEAEVK